MAKPNKSERGHKPSGLEQNRPDLKRDNPNRAEQRTQEQGRIQPSKANGEYVKPGRKTDESQVP
ncbi:MAG TPA: hypothetical protein VHO25_14305 [Polyangiaceae bacterium]|nr:hypothetical protein [Polyangiaceae bacterium]